MFRDEGPKEKFHLNIIFNSGGMGDHIASLVAVDYICRKAHWIIPHLWVPDYMLDLAKNLLRNHEQIVVRKYSDSKKYKKNFMGVSTEWKTQHTGMRTHPVDYAFHMLADHHVENEEKNYLKLDPIDVSNFNLPEKFVLISVGSTSPVKELSPRTINDIADYSNAMGYVPVFVGSSSNQTGSGDEHKAKISEVDYTKGINLVNKTNLVELGSIMTKAKCIIGLDGGLMHLAGCTDLTLVCGFTFVSPHHIMPIRNNELGWNVYPIEQPKSLGCRYCQTNMIWTAELGHDFRDCYYDDFQCVKNMTSDKFIEVLDKILKV